MTNGEKEVDTMKMTKLLSTLKHPTFFSTFILLRISIKIISENTLINFFSIDIVFKLYVKSRRKIYISDERSEANVSCLSTFYNIIRVTKLVF